MSVTLASKPVDPSVESALARWTGTVTRFAPSPFNPALSASDLVRSGRGPNAGAWKAERSAQRRQRRLARLRAIEEAFGA